MNHFYKIKLVFIKIFMMIIFYVIKKKMNKQNLDNTNINR